MRRYETVVILDPDLQAEDRDLLLERTRAVISEMGGMLIEEEHWGNKKFAYEIKKKPRGYYVRYDFCGGGPLVNEMERTFQIDDRVLKYMTVLLEKQVDLDALRQKIEDAQKEEEPSAEEPPVEKSEPAEPEAENSFEEAGKETESEE